MGPSSFLSQPCSPCPSDCSIALSYWLLNILSIIPRDVKRERPLLFKSKRLYTAVFFIMGKKKGKQQNVHQYKTGKNRYIHRQEIYAVMMIKKTNIRRALKICCKYYLNCIFVLNLP